MYFQIWDQPKKTKDEQPSLFLIDASDEEKSFNSIDTKNLSPSVDK